MAGEVTELINSKYTKNSPYLELLYQDISNNQYITYVSSNQEASSYSFLGSDLVYDAPNVLEESKRIFIYNESFIDKPTFNVDPNVFPNVKYLRIENTNLYQMMSIGVATPIVEPPVPAYEVQIINRSSIYIYYPGEIIFVLIDSINKSIYAMQSYNLELDSNLNETSLYLMKEKLINIPFGFTYNLIKVPSNLCIIAVATISQPAIIMRDELGNSYQYLYSNYNPQIYNQFNYSV